MNIEAALFGVAGLVIGNLSSHVSLGRQIERALAELKEVTRRTTALETKLDAALQDSALHFHRRSTDQ